MQAGQKKNSVTYRSWSFIHGLIIQFRELSGIIGADWIFSLVIIKISSVFSRNLAKREFSVQVFLNTDIVRTPRFSIFKKADQRIGLQS